MIWLKQEQYYLNLHPGDNTQLIIFSGCTYTGVEDHSNWLNLCLDVHLQQKCECESTVDMLRCFEYFSGKLVRAVIFVFIYISL